MKKFLLLILVVALTVTFLVGCLPVTPGEGEEEEGEQEEGITIEIEGAVVIEEKTYLSLGSHTVTITFPNPVDGWVKGEISNCSGDYSKGINYIIDDGFYDFECGSEIVFSLMQIKKYGPGRLVSVVF